MEFNSQTAKIMSQQPSLVVLDGINMEFILLTFSSATVAISTAITLFRTQTKSDKIHLSVYYGAQSTSHDMVLSVWCELFVANFCCSCWSNSMSCELGCGSVMRRLTSVTAETATRSHTIVQPDTRGKQLLMLPNIYCSYFEWLVASGRDAIRQIKSGCYHITPFASSEWQPPTHSSPAAHPQCS